MLAIARIADLKLNSKCLDGEKNMKFIKYILTIAAGIATASSALYAAPEQETPHEIDLQERDIEALKHFVFSKRTLDLKEKATKLAISGDVRTEWHHNTEKGFVKCHPDERPKYKSLRGPHSRDCRGFFPISKNDFDIEANLYFDYATERAWASANLQFDNSAGVGDIDCFCEEKGTGKIFSRNNRFHGSGECDDICLKRAFMGYNIFTCNGARLDVEVGRRKLYDVFESEIEFQERFDGILLKYSDQWENVSDWYIQVAGFLIDERVNHFAYVAETAFFNIMDSNFDLKYSFIDWRIHGRTRCGDRNSRAYKYAVSQVVVTYHPDPALVWGLPLELYAAGLVNHLGRQSATAHDDSSHSGHDKPWAWYAGLVLGKVKGEGDWSIELLYEWVQRDAVAYDDQGGIGLGNILGDCCGHRPVVGFKGWQFDFLYAFTDNLSLKLEIQSARNNGDEKHRFSQLEVEAIYAF